MCFTPAKIRAVELLQSVIFRLLTTVFFNSAKIKDNNANDGFIEVIEVGETFFDVLKALLTSILSSLLQVFVVYAGIRKDDYGIVNKLFELAVFYA